MPKLVGAKSDKGPVRPVNEDAYWVSHAEVPTELGALYIVADGVGGQEAGDIAAHKAIEIISEVFYTQRQSGTDVPTALEMAIRQANRLVLELGQARGVGKMGCTVVTAVVHEGYLYVAHVGDARAYLLMGNQLKRLTRDDTWVQKQVEAGVFTPKQAAEHELRNVVTQVLGNKEDIDVHLMPPFELYTNDTFLLCSDGLYDPLSFKQIQRLLHSKSAQTAAEDLVQASIDAQTHDNVTAVVVSAGKIPEKIRAVQSAPRGKQTAIPAWVFATLIVTVLLAAALFVFFVLPNTRFAQNGEPTQLPILNPTTEIAPVPSDTPVVEAVATEVETAVAPTLTEAASTLELLPSATPPPTDTPPPPIEAHACILFESYIWQDAEVQSTSCNEFAGASIASGEEVILVESSAITINGPDSACAENSFMKVQSIADPSLSGWVLANNIQPISPGESCSP